MNQDSYNSNSLCFDQPQPPQSFHPTFQSEAESPFTLDSTPTYVDESPNVFNPHPQSPVYPCEFCGNDAYYGHYCTPQAPFIYPEQCYNQDFNFPQDFQDVPQQYPCCDDCGVTHDAYQCQPMNEVYYYGQNSCYDSTSIGFDQPQPPHNLEYRDEIKIAELKENFNGMSIEIRKKEKLLQEAQWAYLSTHPSKRLLSFCFDDDDEDYTSAITPDEPVLSTEEPDNSLSMGDEHLGTIPATESDQFIESGVETLIPILSESEGIPEHVCDVPSHDNSPPLDVSKDQIEDLSESNNEFSSLDDDSFSIDDIDYVEASPPDSELVKASNDNPILSYDPIIPGNPPNLTPSEENVPKKIYSNPLFDEEIIPMEIDPHSFNVESDLIKSMLNSDSSIIIPLKIDSLFDEFAGELTLFKSIPPGINETDCHP
nr:hypothetical protein [Tanacetum cinerariifolium]